MSAESTFYAVFYHKSESISSACIVSVQTWVNISVSTSSDDQELF